MCKSGHEQKKQFPPEQTSNIYELDCSELSQLLNAPSVDLGRELLAVTESIGIV